MNNTEKRSTCDKNSVPEGSQGWNTLQSGKTDWKERVEQENRQRNHQQYTQDQFFHVKQGSSDEYTQNPGNSTHFCENTKNMEKLSTYRCFTNNKPKNIGIALSWTKNDISRKNPKIMHINDIFTWNDTEMLLRNVFGGNRHLRTECEGFTKRKWGVWGGDTVSPPSEPAEINLGASPGGQSCVVNKPNTRRSPHTNIAHNWG